MRCRFLCPAQGRVEDSSQEPCSLAQLGPQGAAEGEVGWPRLGVWL